MLRLVLVVGLLCWGCDGAVTCKNENNEAVPWYILYKAPNLQQVATGLEYIYMDSTGARKMVPSNNNYKDIKHPNGVLANTLRPILTPIRSMPANLGFISYSDQPPGCSASQNFGHSKGVIIVEKDGTGVWLLHSTPQFPFRRDQDNFWPTTGRTNAQTFICVTFPYSEFSHIGMHLQYIGAFPFEHDIPTNFHKELKDAVNWVKSTPPNNFKKLISSDPNQPFHSIAKQESPQPRVGDLYYTIASQLQSAVKVQTWGCQAHRKPSYCVPSFYKVLNVKQLNTPLGNWGPQNDHSKWCIADNQNIPWTCIADVNRADTQYTRRGGALCLQNTVIKQIFQQLSQETEDCSVTNIMDINTVTMQCDPDPDTDMNP